jgi:hypothetical protein
MDPKNIWYNAYHLTRLELVTEKTVPGLKIGIEGVHLISGLFDDYVSNA